MNTVEILRNVDDILSDETKWCKHEMINSNGACCLLGALELASPDDWPTEARLLLSQVVQKRGHNMVITFNDAYSTSFKDIKEVIQEAIDMAARDV